jgi:transcriptional regulator with XRE-family HTH domain
LSHTASQRIGKTLRDQRLACGKSQAQVARELGVSRSTVTQMELGNRSVKAVDVNSLSRAYGCSAAGLLAAPMEEADREADELIAALIQALPELADGDATALDDLRDAVAVARVLTTLEAELGLKHYSAGPPAHGFSPATTPWEGVHQGYVTAQEERSRVGLGDAPLRDVDETLALMRVRATKTSLPDGVSSLFLRAPETGFLVVVNRGLSLVERRFQYAHAYAHTLFDRERQWLLCRFEGRRSPVEVRANAFASRFLLPEAGVQRYLHSLGKDTLGRTKGATLSLHSERASMAANDKRVRVDGRGRRGATPVTACDVAQIACYFGVSQSLTVHALHNLRCMTEENLAILERHDTEGIVDRAREILNLRTIDMESGRDAFRCRLLGLAVEALHRHSIHEERFAEIVSLVQITDAERQALVDSLET